MYLLHFLVVWVWTNRRRLLLELIVAALSICCLWGPCEQCPQGATLHKLHRKKLYCFVCRRHRYHRLHYKTAMRVARRGAHWTIFSSASAKPKSWLSILERSSRHTRPSIHQWSWAGAVEVLQVPGIHGHRTSSPWLKKYRKGSAPAENLRWLSSRMKTHVAFFFF